MRWVKQNRLFKGIFLPFWRERREKPERERERLGKEEEERGERIIYEKIRKEERSERERERVFIFSRLCVGTREP